MSLRSYRLFAALAGIALAAPGWAQEAPKAKAPQASPAPKAAAAATAKSAPAAKPAPKIKVDVMEGEDAPDAAAIEKAVEAAEQARIAADGAAGEAIEDAARAAANAAMSTVDIMKTQEDAVRRARSVMASREARAAREIAVRVAAEAWGDSAWGSDEQTQTEKEREAAEAKRQAEREAADAKREAQREAIRQQREAQQEQQEKVKEKAEAERDKARERAEAERDRTRERAEAERERARDRAEAQRDRAREKDEQIDQLYDEAMESIDDEDWGQALRNLNKLINVKVKVDAALYWTAYAKAKQGDRNGALVTVSQLQRDYPQSRWVRDSKALELEVRGKSGQSPRPEEEDDIDLKLMALSALAQSDPTEALPLLSKIMASPTAARKVRERALFVMAQMGADRSGSALTEVAKGSASPDLQKKAIEYLGVFGGQGNRKVLSDIYASTNDFQIRRQILNSFMVSGDRARVLNAAKTEQNPALRSEAVRLLGVMGGTAELSQMYQTATTPKEKKDILQALFIGGAVEPVLTAARGEKDKEVRLAAINNLGLMGRKSEAGLMDLYRVETDRECKMQVLNALFLQNNPTRLIEIARTEKDPEFKKQAVHWLSLMNSKESRAYMLELLKD